jgi:hypothetical protein
LETARPGPGDIRILAVGDSMVEAVQVGVRADHDGLLERSLSARLGRSVEIVNAGIGGYDPNQYRMTAQMELRKSRYDLVLVFVYVENDIIGRRVESYPANTALITPVLRPFSDRPADTMGLDPTDVDPTLPAERLAEKASLVDLLKSDVYAEYASRPALLRERFGAHKHALIVIDEIQKIPALLDEVHWLIENTFLSFLAASC